MQVLIDRGVNDHHGVMRARLAIGVTAVLIGSLPMASASAAGQQTVACGTFQGPKWTDTTWPRWGPPSGKPGSGTLYRVFWETASGKPARCGLAKRWAAKVVWQRPRRLDKHSSSSDLLSPPGKSWICSGGYGGRGLAGHPRRFTVPGAYAPVGSCYTFPLDVGSFRWRPADYYDDVSSGLA